MTAAEIQAQINTTTLDLTQAKNALAAAQSRLSAAQSDVGKLLTAIAALEAKLADLQKLLEAALKPALPSGANAVSNGNLSAGVANWTASEGGRAFANGVMTIGGPASVFGADIRGISGKLTLQGAVRGNVNLMIRCWRKGAPFVDFKSASSTGSAWTTLSVTADLPADLDAAVPFVQGVGDVAWVFGSVSAAPPTLPVPSASGWAALPQLGALELVCGPMRGLSALDRALDNRPDDWAWPDYRYYEHEERVDLADLCPRQGVFDFSWVGARVTACMSRKQKFGFGITLWNPDSKSGYPAWLPKNPSSGDPIWRDPGNISLMSDGLPKALAKYLGDNDLLRGIAWIDLRVEGDYGEGEDYAATTEQLQPAEEQQVIDAWLAAFPTTLLLMMTDDRDGLEYAMRASEPFRSRVGMRRDSLGDGSFNGFTLSSFPTVVRDRPLYAPFRAESYGPWNHDWSVIESQVRQNRLAGIKDQNHGTRWRDFTPENLARWKRSESCSGYRLTVLRANRPASAKRGEMLNVDLEWNNSANNVTPLFVDMRPELVVLDSSGKQVLVQPVGFDLRTLRPGQTAQSQTSFPTADLALGAYTLLLRVVDPIGIYRPLELALAGRRDDNSYSLGSLSIV